LWLGDGDVDAAAVWGQSKDGGLGQTDDGMRGGAGWRERVASRANGAVAHVDGVEDAGVPEGGRGSTHLLLGADDAEDDSDGAFGDGVEVLGVGRRVLGGDAFRVEVLVVQV
jgi:hypothetical protein